MNIEAKSIYVIGDVHGEVDTLNEMLKLLEPEVAILLGDVGLFWNHQNYVYSSMSSIAIPHGKPKFSEYAFQQIDSSKTKIFWLMGNHEEFNYVEKNWGRVGKEPIEIKPNLFYCPIGSTLSINGKECLFIGGALSIDKEYRTMDVDWFKQEELNSEDFSFIEKFVEGKKIHTIFSHTCPHHFTILAPHDKRGHKFEDNSCKILRDVRESIQPDYWFFGHWHRFKGGYCGNTTWQCINTISEGWEEGGRSFLDISLIF